MPKIIGVKFKDAGKVYYFEPGDNIIRYHDHVIVETARGLEYGTVVISPTDIPEEKITQPLKPVIRMATEEDDVTEKENRQKEKEAYRVCKQKIAEHGLDMKLIEAEYTFDNSKVLFYFTADGRIDFRDLVKDLAGIFRTRIELRQIGVRDETKLLGGIGSCGRPLCCHTWLNEFAPVSIKMAKDQNLSLNPTKISGTCGRLMCCLKNEAETYACLNKGMPGKGDYVTTQDGLHGDVQSVNILRQTVRVILELENDEKELREFSVNDITFIPKSKKIRMLQEAKNEAAKKAAMQEAEELQKENADSDAADNGEDPDLIWDPDMENFNADDYVVKEDRRGKNDPTQRKKNDRRKRQNKNRDAAGEGEEDPTAENASGKDRDNTRKNKKFRQKPHGDRSAEGTEAVHGGKQAGEDQTRSHVGKQVGEDQTRSHGGKQAGEDQARSHSGKQAGEDQARSHGGKQAGENQPRGRNASKRGGNDDQPRGGHNASKQTSAQDQNRADKTERDTGDEASRQPRRRRRPHRRFEERKENHAEV